MRSTIAVGIFCKTPAPGQSKTRLSPPLRLEECAALSACFIRDLTQTIGEVARDEAAAGYAVYTPRGSEDALRQLLPGNFSLHAQCDGEFGLRLSTAIRELLAVHAGVIVINADSPTLPASILRDAIAAVRTRKGVVLSPALDGGYTLIGLSQMHEELFVDIPWSTETVYADTVARAREIGVPVVDVPGWYDVDDAASLNVLLGELAGKGLSFTTVRGADAPATRAYFARQPQHPVLEAAK